MYKLCDKSDFWHLIRATRTIIIILFCIVYIDVKCHAVIYVNQNATGTNNGASWENAFTDLGDAVTTSSEDTTFWVAKGLYYENLTLKNKMRLYGGFNGSELIFNDRDYRENITIIDGAKKGRVIIATENNIIDGFIITNGVCNVQIAGAGIYSTGSITIQNNIIDNNISGPYEWTWGGGIFIRTTNYYFIRNNVFIKNSATQWGASLFIYQSSNGIVENNIFTDNNSLSDGNLFLFGSNVPLRKNIFCGNHGFARAAGMEYFGSHSTLNNNLFVGNYATKGSAVYNYGTIYGIMQNNTIAFNSSSNSNAIELDGSGDFDFHNNIIAYNTGYGISEHKVNDPTPNGILKNNLFFMNSSGAYYDLNSGKVIDTESGLNSLNPPGTNEGNIIRNPGFMSGPAGILTSTPVFDDLRRQTTFTDSSAAWSDLEMAGKFINPNMTQPLQFYIVKNTRNTITVWGDASVHTSAGSAYQIYDYHLADGSPAIDRANVSLAPPDDFDGDARPGTDGKADIGYDEAPDSFINNLPSCIVQTPQSAQSDNVSINYTLLDFESNTLTIIVECSLDGGQNWIPAIEGPGSDGTSNLQSSRNGVPHVFVWDTITQGIKGKITNARIRITPSDYETGPTSATDNFTVDNTKWQPVTYFSFDQGCDGWTTFSIPQVFASPNFRWENSGLRIAAVNNIDTFGFWQSSLDGIPLEKGYLYRARYTISSTVSDPRRIPLIRLRAASTNNQVNYVMEISSKQDGLFEPTATPRVYDLYFTPARVGASSPDNNNVAGVVLFMDIVNFDDSDDPYGAVLLHDVSITRIVFSDLIKKETLATWTFNNGNTNGWFSVSIPSKFTPPNFTTVGNALNISGKDANTFGYWTTDKDMLEIKNDVLYCGTFTIDTDVADQSLVPCFRLRFNTESSESAAMLEVPSLNRGENSPTPAGEQYMLFYVPPQHLAGTTLNDLNVSFDIKSFDNNDAVTGRLGLKEAIVETYEMLE